MKRSHGHTFKHSIRASTVRSVLSLRIALGCLPLSAFAAVVMADGPRPPILGRRAQPAADGPLDQSQAGLVDVYLNDSFEAADALSSAKRLAVRGRWREAAVMLQRIAADPARKLVRVSPGYYVGIRRHVADVIAEWPPEGLAVYRAMYDKEVSEALAARKDARNVEELLGYFDQYFSTEAAGNLADHLGQLAVEGGDYALAYRVYQRALKHHPDRRRHERQWRAMLAVAAALDPNISSPDLEPEDSAFEVRWRGASRRLDEVLGEIRETFDLRDARTATDASVWPIFAGHDDRMRVAATDVDEMGLLWRVDLARGLVVDARSGGDAGDAGRPDAAVGKGAGDDRVSMHPVVDGARVIVQRFRRVFALNVNTGSELWRFNADVGDLPRAEDFDDRPPRWDSPTISGNRVFAALSGDSIPYYGYESARTTPELVSLDLTTGELLWRASEDRLGDEFSEFQFDSSPIVAYGRVYIVSRQRRSFGFEDCYLHAFSAADGAPKFRTHLGSASTGSFSSHQVTLAIPALDGDTVYVCSNLGTIAAVSAHTGAVRWLRLYERMKGGASGSSSWASRGDGSRSYNPTMIAKAGDPAGGRVVCLPNDSDQLLVLAASDGHALATIPVGELGGMRTLLGLRDDLLCGSGPRSASCYDLARQTLSWSAPLPEDDPVVGRGVWADDRLLIPSKTGVHVVDTSSQAISTLPWDADGQPGNMVALPDRLVVAGDTTVSVYVRKEEIWTALRRRMAEAPDDPNPALDLAEVALGAGQTQDALAALAEASRRAGGLGTATDPAVRGRVFSDALRFSQKLAQRDKLEPEVLSTLYDYASRCPSSRAEHVQYRLRFAVLFTQLGVPQRAIQLYQQVLRDRSLREYTGASVDGSTAGAFAKKQVAVLIEAHGRAIYAQVDAQAATALKEAEASRSSDALERVLESFPNSKAAPRALVAQGRLFSDLGEPVKAAAKFAAAYHRYPQDVDRPEQMRLIADAYVRAERLGDAYRWLTKAAREHPTARIDVDGRQVSFAEYRARFDAVRAEVEPSRPHLELPLTRQIKVELPDGAKLLSPRFAAASVAAWSRAFVYWTSPETPGSDPQAPASNNIRALDATTLLDVWEKPAVSPPGAELLIATAGGQDGPAGVAVFANLYEVVGLDVGNGRRLWSHGHQPLRAENAVGDWEDEASIRSHAFHGDRLLTARDDGSFVLTRIGDGQILWERTHDSWPIVGRIRLTDAWVVYQTVKNGVGFLCRLDASTGDALDTWPTNDPGIAEDIIVTLDGLIVLASSDTLMALDPAVGAIRWQLDLQGRLHAESLVTDVDAVFFVDGGRQLKKVSIDDGHLAWVGQRIVSRGAEGVTAELQAGTVVVSSLSSVAGVDAVTGLTLWKGIRPDHTRFVSRQITRNYVMAVHIPEALPLGGDRKVAVADRGDNAVAYFYDHRNGSGVIPKNGGALSLGSIRDVVSILAVDSTLLIQSGSTLHAWTHE